jgi:hypothetical protein
MKRLPILISLDKAIDLDGQSIIFTVGSEHIEVQYCSTASRVAHNIDM